MSTVQTIRGPVDSSELGWTLSHEHLTAGGAGMEQFPSIYDEGEAIAAALAALRRAKDAGVDALVDLTTFDLGRQASLFERVADADTGVHLVCATGVYRWVPLYLNARSPDEVAEHFLRELDHGIAGSSIRPGIIKIAWDQEHKLDAGPPERTVRSGLERTARGAARAAKAAGVPISCHTAARDELGTPLLDLFEDEGLDLGAVTIGHSDDTDDLDYLLGLAARGATVGLDRHSPRHPADELDRRSGLAAALAGAGYARQVSLSHDTSPYYCFAARSADVDMSDCWLTIPEREIPWLRDHGVTDDQIDAMTVRSVASTFEAAAQMAAG
jgi:phosphotriesterase-related protein